MAKAKSNGFFCKECGHESAKWSGQCPACKAWNTMVEGPPGPGPVGAPAFAGAPSRPVSLGEIGYERHEYIPTGFGELDRVLGCGIVNGSLVLVGGDPGIGKSTILLQVARNIAAGGKKVLYVSGEESLQQVKLRAARIGPVTGELYFYCETNLGRVASAMEEMLPDMVVIDSIQTMYCDFVDSGAGSVSQVREATATLLKLSKGLGIAIFIIGHVTKEGVVAGPRMLEHMVDTVLYFEGDRHASYRILRGVKNRFGSTNEIGVFQMEENGLAEVKNPSEFMLSERPRDTSGGVVTCSLEGTRPILLEVQALVSRTSFGMPRRTAAGVDYNRVNLLLAVLEKRCRYDFSGVDAYVSIAGGVRANEPALDLAICLALVSSYKDKPFPAGTVVFGEVGLSGEIRAVSGARQRIAEAERLGFATCILPKSCLKDVKAGIALVGVESIKEAVAGI
ncbi:MAG: DNA repair protein RadA [Lachnospiraceae bacterium]|jgi:DNA repair protein RadA/Sms|nr:DNA repair protein RadA [Lachnospiraceae bacterium]